MERVGYNHLLFTMANILFISRFIANPSQQRLWYALVDTHIRPIAMFLTLKLLAHLPHNLCESAHTYLAPHTRCYQVRPPSCKPSLIKPHRNCFHDHHGPFAWPCSTSAMPWSAVESCRNLILAMSQHVLRRQRYRLCHKL
jgi:hypothetical protein